MTRVGYVDSNEGCLVTNLRHEQPLRRAGTSPRGYSAPGLGHAEYIGIFNRVDRAKSWGIQSTPKVGELNPRSWTLLVGGLLASVAIMEILFVAIALTHPVLIYWMMNSSMDDGTLWVILLVLPLIFVPFLVIAAIVLLFGEPVSVQGDGTVLDVLGKVAPARRASDG